jgi:hypothetical protein
VGRPATYVVAITRWSRPPQEEAAALAPILGGTAYDLRMRLGGPLPVVVAVTEDSSAATELRSKLREMGHGAVACDLARVSPASAMCCPRELELGAMTLTAHDPDRGSTELAYHDIAAIVWARHATTTLTTTEEKRRRFSVGRAMLTGGLMVSKATTVRGARAEEETQEQVVYLFRRSGEGHVLLHEGQLRYGGLGAARTPTRSQNFRVLVDLLRTRATGALFDARLATSHPRTETAPPGTPGSAALSGVDVTDLTAHLVVIARLQDQI